MSKRKEMIQLFDSISKFNTYSKYSNSLKKIFKNHSLKEYIKSLKNPIRIDTFQFITDFDKRTKKMEEEDDFNLYPKGYNKKGKQLDLLHEESIPEEQEQTQENKEITKKTLFKNKSVNNALLYRQEGLDPFKYNPNYNSIYKNVPSFRYIQKKSSPNKKIIKNRTSLFNNIKNKKIQNIKKMNIKINTNNINFHDSQDFENEKNSEKYEFINIASDKKIKSRNSKTLPMLNTFTPKSKNQKKRSKLKNFKSCDNHAFRFSKYIPRKMNIYKVNNRLTYLEPHCYFSSDKNNKAIDFNKMEYRNSNRWIDLGRLTNPSFYNYNPNYDSIEKHHIKIIFNPKDYEKNNKKNIIKKIWASYDVGKEYLSIDNSKLQNNQ
jgi:hypothetical protein